MKAIAIPKTRRRDCNYFIRGPFLSLKDARAYVARHPDCEALPLHVPPPGGFVRNRDGFWKVRRRSRSA